MRIGLLILGMLLHAQDVTAFRGDGTACYPQATPPTTWSPTTGVVWKAALPGWSNASPLILGDLVITLDEAQPPPPAANVKGGSDVYTGDGRVAIVAVSLGDGTVRWRLEVTGRPVTTHRVTGYTSHTPVSDGTRIYAVFSTGLAVACDRSGTLAWKADLEAPANGKWGGCMSPVLAGGHLLVHLNQLWALDPATGATRWKSKAKAAWGTPAVLGDLVLTSGGGACRLANGAAATSDLPALEFNSATVLDGIAYALQTDSRAWRPAGAVWQAKLPKERYYATPLLHNGLVYGLSQKGRLHVLDAGTGQAVYDQQIADLKGVAYPSPILAGGHLYLSTDTGVTVVAKPGRSWQPVAVNQLESFRSTPVATGSRLYIRGVSALWCLGR